MELSDEWLKPMTDEELAKFKPVTDEEIRAALEQGRKEAEAAFPPHPRWSRLTGPRF